MLDMKIDVLIIHIYCASRFLALSIQYIYIYIKILLYTDYLYMDCVTKHLRNFIITRKSSDYKDTSYETYMRDGDRNWSRLPHFIIDKDI